MGKINRGASKIHYPWNLFLSIQAIRLPKAFRVKVEEMWISKNEVTGEVVLKPKVSRYELEAFFEELRAMPVTEDFHQTQLPRA